MSADANRKKWVEALRSGDYKQVDARLHRVVNGEDRYCCLGVACELYRQEVGGEWLKLSDGVDWLRFEPDPVDITGDAIYLPIPVYRWLGLVDDGGSLREELQFDIGLDDPFVSKALTDLNDRAGQTFDQIADQIESGNVKTND